MGHPCSRKDALGLRGDGGDFGGVDGDEAAVLSAVLEADDAGDLGEEGVVLAAAEVEAGLQLGAALDLRSFYGFRFHTRRGRQANERPSGSRSTSFRSMRWEWARPSA
jgi:hypothetical protein